MNPILIGLFECPICHQALEWKIDKGSKSQIEQAISICTGCRTKYPVREGIGIFLTPELPRNDLWEQVESRLSIYLRDHPDLEMRLMDSPIEDLSATDQQFRAQLLEERGEFDEARRVEDFARQNLYTDAYNRCWLSQIEYTLEQAARMDGPIVDLASGRGYLVERIARELKRPVIATDFSLSILRRDKAFFEFLGLSEYVSLLAFDARLTPFRDGSIGTMTTNLGLPNIEQPGRLLEELHRILEGDLLAISHFFPAEDMANRRLIEEISLDALLYRESAVEHFRAAGWDLQIENTCVSAAEPTPESVIFEGARADGLPVAPTELEWCVLHAVSASCC
jgi:uncharacterized protein YbaR (Trm112 family)